MCVDTFGVLLGAAPLGSLDFPLKMASSHASKASEHLGPVDPNSSKAAAQRALRPPADRTKAAPPEEAVKRAQKSLGLYLPDLHSHK